MSEKTILLHLGTHKTGSTTLQSNLFRHRAVLAAHGITYLGTDNAYPHLYSAFMTRPMDYVWNRKSGLTEAEIRARDAEVRAQLQRELEAAPGPVVILSSEFLSKLSADELHALRAFLAPHGRVEAIYYYRELLSWISSDSQQLAKAGLRVRPTRFDTAMERLYDFPLKIQEVFGAEATTFIRFEDAIARGICNSFLSAFDLPDFDRLGLTEERANESISENAVRALFLYNHLHPIGSPTRRPQEVKRLRALPGEKYRVAGLLPRHIKDYARKRDIVCKRLGLTLAPAKTLPVSAGLDPVNDAMLRIVDQHRWSQNNKT